MGRRHRCEENWQLARAAVGEKLTGRHRLAQAATLCWNAPLKGRRPTPDSRPDFWARSDCQAWQYSMAATDETSLVASVAVHRLAWSASNQLAVTFWAAKTKAT